MNVSNLLSLLGHPDVKSFQKHMGLSPDGVVGPKTGALLERYDGLIAAAPAIVHMIHGAPHRVTQYYFAEEKSSAGPLLPIFDANGAQMAMVRSSFFSEAALEGSGILIDGRAINVAGQYVPLPPAIRSAYDPVLIKYNRYVEVQRAKGLEPKPTRYFGFDRDVLGITAVQAFRFRTDISENSPFGLGKLGIPFKPFGTLATDTGYPGWKNPEPRYKGKGGLLPPGTRVFFLERGTWYTANDTGGGIYGAHVDEFVGTAALRKTWPSFPRGHLFVDLPDANERFPIGYDRGLW